MRNGRSVCRSRSATSSWRRATTCSMRTASSATATAPIPNVLTALEFERLTNASGPDRRQDRRQDRSVSTSAPRPRSGCSTPRDPLRSSVAIIHCVGSRDTNYNAYCSRVCCMYSLKFAHLVTEKLPDATCYEFYIDMRAFGKGYDEFFRTHQSRGDLRHARPHRRPGHRARRPDVRQGRGHHQRQDAGVSGRHGPPCGRPRARQGIRAARLDARHPARRRRLVRRSRLQRRPDRHRARWRLRRRSVPGTQRHPGHGRPGLCGGGSRAEEHRQR